MKPVAKFEPGDLVVLTDDWQYNGKDNWDDVPNKPRERTVGKVERDTGNSHVAVKFEGYDEYENGLSTDRTILAVYSPEPTEEEMTEAMNSILHGRRVWTLAEAWEEGYLACLDEKHQQKDNPFA